MTERADFIPVTRPLLDEREVEASRRPILSGWVTQGKEVAAFEREFAEAVGAKHACAVSSGTAALHLALMSVGVRPGDEVVTVSHSYIATANAIRHCGATPVFVDVEPDTFNMDPERIEQALTDRTRAILCVHQMGLPCDLPAILAIGERHGLPVVEDAACAAGSEILWQDRWERIGKPRGVIACFSFHPRKLITTGDGGMLTTSSAEHDERFRLWRQHGMGVPDAVRHASRQVIFESYPEVGYNYRMTDIQAAVGREQLKRLSDMVERRRRLAERYDRLLADLPGLQPPATPPWARGNYQSYCIRLPDGCGQRDVMQALLDAEIATRRGVMCAHREPAYPRGTWRCGGEDACNCAPGTCERLRNGEIAQDRCIVLPMYHEMTDADQDAVVRALQEALR